MRKDRSCLARALHLRRFLSRFVTSGWFTRCVANRAVAANYEAVVEFSGLGGVVGFLFDVDAGIVPEMLPLLRNVFARFLQ